MIKFTDVSFGFPQKDLYNKICFEIETGEHAVLIGSNGTGKSTLTDMIINTDDYLYDGKIEKNNCGRIGYVSQFINHEHNDITVFDYLAEPFVQLQTQADEICAKMAEAEDVDEIYERYQTILDEIDAVDGYNFESNIKKQLATAGISHLQDNSINKISGGEFKLITIIKNMLTRPQLIIMDEPDVFLDFENIVGLSKLINNYDGTLLSITHSRLLLSQCFNKILHLENMELQEFPGTFAEYNREMLENKVVMKEQAVKDGEWIKIQQALVDKLRKEASMIDNPAKGRQVKARATYLARLIERRTPDPFIEDFDYDFEFSDAAFDEEGPDKQKAAISVRDYSLTYDREILKNVSFEIMEGEKVAIVGANGTGKSSLLRDIYEKMKKDSENDEKLNFFSQIYDEDEKEKLSGGERNIRQLKKISEGKASILFLDEPTSHLDTYAQIALENAVANYKGTVLMVTHDFYTVANCAERILILENGTVREMSARAYRKSIYKKYFNSDIFEAERLRKETEVRINALLKQGKYKEAKEILGLQNE